MEFREPKPIYKQIADYIIHQLLDGTWSDGQRIPSVRELASDIEVNPNTVARTYSLLSDQGIIYTKRGVGYFLHEGANESAKNYLRAQFEKEDIPYIKKIVDILQIDIAKLISKK